MNCLEQKAGRYKNYYLNLNDLNANLLRLRTQFVYMMVQMYSSIIFMSVRDQRYHNHEYNMNNNFLNEEKHLSFLHPSFTHDGQLFFRGTDR